MPEIIPSDYADAAWRKSRTRTLIFFIGWSLFVAAALWWLSELQVQQGSWVIHDGGVQQSWSERVRDWFFLVHFNFQRIYPWVLLGPYVAWLGTRFVLERGRLRLNLPLHLTACALFLLAAHVIQERSANRVARVVIITSQTNIQTQLGTNAVHIEISRTTADDVARQEFTRFNSQNLNSPDSADFLYLHKGPGYEGLTNFPPDLDHELKEPHFPSALPSLRPLSVLLDLFAYCAIVGLAHSVHFYRRYREREHRALSLESTLAKARLSALQTQLQPHFLFNSLNAIVTLLRRDPRLAEATLMSLSDLLRLTLSQSDKQEVTLREELQFAQSYVEIQQTRFGDRLHFEKSVEPAALGCLVPTLLLQPLIENAIRHGIEPSESAGMIRLTVEQREAHLVIVVEDDGVGLMEKGASSLRLSGDGTVLDGRPADLSMPLSTEPEVIDPIKDGSRDEPLSSIPEKGTGIGLANLRARLETLYGANQRLAVTQRNGGGVSVRIEVPWRLVGTGETAELTGRAPPSPLLRGEGRGEG